MNNSDTNYLASIWQDSLIHLKKFFNSHLYETWVKSTIPISINDTTIELGTQKQFIKDWFEERYIPVFKEALREASNKDYEVVFTNLDITESEKKLNNVPSNNKNFDKTQNNYIKFLEDIDDFSDEHDYENHKETSREISKEAFTEQKTINHNTSNLNNKVTNARQADRDEVEISYTLNPKYIFSTFVIGNSNRLAHAASLAVSETPAQIYNPLFIYGGVGLGKTHLMHAIGHSIRDNFKNLKVVYISSEKFTNELINSIRDGNPESFRQRYRYIDVLLIDDIQFLTKKERTQEEFFHTFNILHGNNKQIIISSDRPPKEIETLEDRLRSRFEWGLITDISPPDLETRIAVLRKKAMLQNLDVPNDVILYIASLIKNNIRELEGALIRVIAFASLHKLPITMELATEALTKLFPNVGSKQITIELIKEVVASYFKIKIEDLAAKNRTRNITYPRQIAMYLCRELTDNSLPKIGQMFGGRDHTTVIHSHEKIVREKSSDVKLDIAIKELTKKIKD